MSAQHQDNTQGKAKALSQLLAQLEDSSRRFSRLELDALEIEKLILKDAQKQKLLFHSSNQTADQILNSLTSFENELTSMKLRVRNLSLSFKELIKQESVDEMETKIDEWPLEEFITRKELNNMLLAPSEQSSSRNSQNY